VTTCVKSDTGAKNLSQKMSDIVGEPRSTEKSAAHMLFFEGPETWRIRSSYPYNVTLVLRTNLSM
jgi:hypothetical protein